MIPATPNPRRPSSDPHHPSHYRQRYAGAARRLLTQRLAAAGSEHLPTLRQALEQEHRLKSPHPRIIAKLTARIDELST